MADSKADKWVTVLTVEQINDRINQCDQHIKILQQKILEQEDVKRELQLMRMEAERKRPK